jgi:hypothetical protein
MVADGWSATLTLGLVHVCESSRHIHIHCDKAAIALAKFYSRLLDHADRNRFGGKRRFGE